MPHGGGPGGGKTVRVWFGHNKCLLPGNDAARKEGRVHTNGYQTLGFWLACRAPTSFFFSFSIGKV